MSAVGNALAKIDPGPAIGSAGKAIESGVREIGKGAESLGREIGKVGEAAAKNPVGTIAKVAAIATGQAWALPLISATEVVANGGSLEQALKAGAISYAASVVAAGISDSLNSAFANELTSSVGDASLTASNTLADGSIQHVFSDGSTILQGVNGALSTTPATIAPSVMSQLATQLPTSVLTSINTALANAGGSAAMTALKGGDLSEVLLSGASAGAGSFAGTQTTGQLKDLGLNDKVAQVLGRTTGAVTSGVVEGQDAGQIFNTALVNNIVRTSLSEAGTALKNTEVAKGLTKTLNEAIQPFKDTVNSAKQTFLDEAKKLTNLQTETDAKAKELIDTSNTIKTEAETYYNDTLKASETTAQDAYKVAEASYTDYKTKRDEFDGLVAKHKEATDAGDIELADSYADKANALIPSLNAATDKYNKDFTTYDTAKADFETKNKTYGDYVTQLTELNDEYTNVFKPVEDQLAVVNKSADGFNASVDEMQNTLNTTAKTVEDAYVKASDYSSIAKGTFEEIFGETGDLTRASNLSEQVNVLPEDNQRMYEFAKTFGLREEDALKFAPDISKMSLVATQTFYDSLAKNADTTNALTTANQVNSLTDKEQDSFYNAKLKGLDTAQAFDVANNVSWGSKEQQDQYISSIKSGLGSELSSIFSVLSDYNKPSTQLQDINEVNLAKLKTEEAKDAYKYYIYGGADSNTALAIAQGRDDTILSQGTQGTLVASNSNQGSITSEFLPGVTPYISAPVKTQFGDTHYWDKEKDQWVPVPTEGVETGGIGGGTGLDIGVSGNAQQGPLNQAEIDKYKAEGISESDIQKLVEKYGIAGSAPTVDQPDYYQSLIDDIFKDEKVKANKLATTATAPVGGTTPGTTTTTPGGTTTGTGAGTTTGTGTGTGTTGPTTTGGTNTGGTGTGGTGTGSGTGGGTQPGTGGTGGTEPGTGGGGTGTGGTGTGGTGTGGTGTGGTGTGGTGGTGGGSYTIPGGMYGMYGLTGQDATGGIKNLTAGLTERMNFDLSGLPSDEDKENPMYNAPQMIQQMAGGGSASYDPFSITDTAGKSGISGTLTPSLTKAQLNYILTGMPDYLQSRAEGGHIEDHNPQFYSEGGLNSLENRYVKGDGDGTSDDVPAMLANGEFVIPADVVSKLGNGSNDAGAEVLDEFLSVIRKHAQNHDPKKLPPDSKGALAYLEEAQQRAKA